MKIIHITFLVLINLTLSINASSLVDERIEIDGTTESSGFVAFDVYELIDDIAKSQGLSYEAYTNKDSHPGIENTKSLMIELINLILQKKQDELAFIQDLHAKIEALPETTTAEGYAQIHPWFSLENRKSPEETRRRLLEMTTDQATLRHIYELDLSIQRVQRNDFGSFFVNATNYISDYLQGRAQSRNALRLPSTNPKEIIKLINSGQHWDASTAEQSASMMSLRIALLRLSARFIPTTCINEDCSFNLYITRLDQIVFADEHDGYSLDPDSLISIMDERCRKVKEEKEKFIEKKVRDLSRQGIFGEVSVDIIIQDCVPKSFKSVLEEIIKKISAGHIAMPKPFGTRALLEAKEKARIQAEKIQLEANKKAVIKAEEQLEANKKAAIKAKEQAKKSRAALIALSIKAGKKAAAIQQSEEAKETTSLSETFNAVGISSEASARSATVDIPNEASAMAISSNLDDHAAATSEGFALASAAAAFASEGFAVSRANEHSATASEGFALARVNDHSATASEGFAVASAAFFQKANIGKKAAISSREESSKEANLELCWVKHATEDRYVPSRKISLTRTQHSVLEAIRLGEKFSFTMDKFTSFMEGLGITEQSRKGSHAHFSTPGRLPKIFVNPHGWTNTFGPGAMKGMLDLVHSLSLGKGSEYV